MYANLFLRYQVSFLILGVSREELDNNELYIYTCTCNSSSAEENFSCKGSIDTYYLNNTLLLNDLQMTSDGTYQCLLAQNKTDNQSTIVRLPKWGIKFSDTYTSV